MTTAGRRAGAEMAVLAAAPLLVAGVAIALRRPRIAWTGDRALTELAVREAARLNQLLGIGGRFGWRHPGPLWMYLLVPIYVISGRAPWSLSVGVVALHVASIVVAVLAASWAGGRRAGAVMAALVGAYLAATGLRYWTNLWAGYAFTWPVLALISLLALATSEERAGWALPGAALIGTLLVQTDVSTILVVGIVGVVAVALRLVRTGPRGFAGGGHRAAILLVALVVVAWVPPGIEQITAHPGNLTLLARFGAHAQGGYPLRAAMGATGAALSVLPLGARWVLRNGVEHRLGAGPWWAVGLTVSYLLGTAAAALLAWRRGRRLAGDLSLLSFFAVAAAVVSMSRVTGPISFYLLTWITIVPVAALTAIALAVASDSRGRDPLALGAIAVAAALTGWVIVRGPTVHDYDRAASASASIETARVDTMLGGAARGRVRLHIVTADAWQLGAGVGLQLERQGARIEVDPAWVFLFGDAFRPGGAPPSAEVWFARPHELPLVTPLPGVVDVGATDGIDVLVRRG